MINTLFRLACFETSYFPKILIDVFEKLNGITCSRTYVLKYFQKLVAKILMDPQYGESLTQSIKQKPEKYSTLVQVINNKSVFLEISNIWRKGPESKEQAELIFKTNQIYHTYDEEKLDSINELSNFDSKFPFIPEKAIKMVNMDELKNEKVKNLSLYSAEVDDLKKQR